MQYVLVLVGLHFRRFVLEMEAVSRKRRWLSRDREQSNHSKNNPYSVIYSKEAARLESFNGCPIPEIRNPRELAKAGFYYLGFTGAVECFYCGNGHDNLAQGIDIFYEHVKYYPECPFIREAMGEDYFRDIKRRIREERMKGSADELLLSYENTWPDDAQKTAEELAEAGFFYTGQKDLVQCHQCLVDKKNWQVYDDAWFQHAKLSPKCKFVSDFKGAEFSTEVSLVALSVSVKKEHEDRLQLLKSEQSVNQSSYNTKYSSEGKRLISYKGLSNTYIQKQELSEVGFYHTGTKVYVKCFYCGIELSLAWLRAKDAAVEHAKFSPSCSFIRQLKGDFFDLEETRIKSFEKWPTWSFKTPKDLAKAGFFYTENDDQTQCFECGVRFMNWKIYDDPWFIHSMLSPSCKFVLRVKGEKFVDLVKLASMPKENKNTAVSSDKSAENIEDEVNGELQNLMNSITIQTALNLGFDEVLIRNTLQNRLNNDESFETPEEIFSAVLESQRQDPIIFPVLQNLEKNDKRIQEMKVCKICERQGPMVIFIPCGHLLSCCSCVKNLKKCMGCDEEIKFKLEMFPNNTISA